MGDYRSHDRAVWQAVFGDIPVAWYDAPASDAMRHCRAFFERHPCRHVLDLGCGFGRWAQYLAGHGVQEIVGVDYAPLGVRAASDWARRHGFGARFAAGSAMALPFRSGVFDGVIAALILDNLSRDDAAHAVVELNRVVQPGARGFFVFNPLMTAADLAALPGDNPTKDCMHVVYDDGELASLLAGWSTTPPRRSAEGFRLIESSFAGFERDRPR